MELFDCSSVNGLLHLQRRGLLVEDVAYRPVTTFENNARMSEK